MYASKQFSYLVLKSLRFSGRDFEPGSVFNARRLDPQRQRLQRWVDEGYLQHPHAEPEVEDEVEDLEEEDDGVLPF